MEVLSLPLEVLINKRTKQERAKNKQISNTILLNFRLQHLIKTLSITWLHILDEHVFSSFLVTVI